MQIQNIISHLIPEYQSRLLSKACCDRMPLLIMSMLKQITDPPQVKIKRNTFYQEYKLKVFLNSNSTNSPYENFAACTEW